MIWIKRFRYLAFAAAFLCAITAHTALFPGAQATPVPLAQPQSTIGLTSGLTIAASFEPPAGKGAPKMTTGGGRRNTSMCEVMQSSASSLALEQLLVALIPNTNNGLTVAARPSFWFYIPPTTEKTAEFILEDASLNDRDPKRRLTSMQIDLTTTPAIVSLTPAATDPALEVDRDYTWGFSILCERNSANNPTVRGKIRRVKPSPSLAAKLDKASPLEQVNLYAASGIWYDAVTKLASLRRDQAKDAKVTAQLTAEWKELLQSVGLGAIAAAPLK